MELMHWDMNIYSIKPLNGKGLMHTINQQQLFNLQKSQGDINLLDEAPDTSLPINLTRKTPERNFPQHSHQYGTRFKAKANSIL